MGWFDKWRKKRDGYAEIGDAERHQVTKAKKSGRQARANAETIERTRTQEVAGHARDIAKEGAFIAADVVVPGTGTAAGALDSVNSARNDVKAGQSKKSAVGKNAAKSAAGQIPVIGQFLGIVESTYGIVKAVGQPAKSRTAEKYALALRGIEMAKVRLVEIEELEAQIDMMDLDAVPERDRKRLGKARLRIEQMVTTIELWDQRKEEHGTKPLLNSLDGTATDSSAASNED